MSGTGRPPAIRDWLGHGSPRLDDPGYDCISGYAVWILAPEYSERLRSAEGAGQPVVRGRARPARDPIASPEDLPAPAGRRASDLAMAVRQRRRAMPWRGRRGRGRRRQREALRHPRQSRPRSPRSSPDGAGTCTERARVVEPDAPLIAGVQQDRAPCRARPTTWCWTVAVLRKRMVVPSGTRRPSGEAHFVRTVAYVSRLPAT